MNNKRSSIDIDQRGSDLIELVLRDPEGSRVTIVRVSSPNFIDQWLGISWEDKVLKAFTKLDKQRVQEDLKYEEGSRIVKKLDTDVGKEP